MRTCHNHLLMRCMVNLKECVCTCEKYFKNAKTSHNEKKNPPPPIF